MKRGLALVAIAGTAVLGCHAPSRPAPIAPARDSSRVAARTTSAAAAGGDSASSDTTDRVAPPEVTGEALQMFGDTIGVPAPAAATAVAEPTWDIDVRSFETHDRVEYYVDRLTHAARDRFAVELARSGRYEPMIRAKLRAAGLPEDMTYLALIESGYNPNAYSSAAAVGLWQLMTSTARGTGLRVDWWIDERRDPVRSTDGAIKFLRWLNEQFGSLYLAAAAYDGGPGRIARGLKRYADELEGTSGDSAFFALAEKDYLRAETRDYVPKLIAAALIAKDPTRYGMTVSYDPPLAYDSVRVGPATPLAAIAKASGTSVSEIVSLNPHILRGMTPPDQSYAVRIPLGAAASFDSAFSALRDADRVALTRVKVKKGETVRTIARRAGLTTTQLAWYNRGLKPSKSGHLVVGRAVLVPSAAVVAAALDVPDPSVERYGSSRGRTATHVVRPGETLSGIAARYHTSVSSLMRLNGLRRSMIVPGQMIIVRATSGAHARTRARKRQVS